MIASIPSSQVDRLHVDHGPVNLIVIHDMECPLEPGRAVSWAKYLAANPYPFFAQLYGDPENLVQVAPIDTKVAHCGNGNEYLGHRSVGIEHAGYASYLRARWLQDDGMSMMRLTSAAAAKIAVASDLPRVWLSPTDLLNGKRGFTSHHNCSIALHGSTHTDPDPNFPIDVWMGMVTDFAAGGAPVAPTTGDDMAELWQHPDGRWERTWINPANHQLETRWQTVAGGNFGPYLTVQTPGVTFEADSLAASKGLDGNFNWSARKLGGGQANEYIGWYQEPVPGHPEIVPGWKGPNDMDG